MSLFLLLILHLTSLLAEHTYIVHMDFEDKENSYATSLNAISETAKVIYTYKHAIQGFSARLTPEEVESLLVHPGVLAVVPEARYKLQTTRTPFFLGLDDVVGAEYLLLGSSDVVVGVIDTGIWPESKSFDDKGFGPLPSNWKGECEQGTNFTALLCNRKLIGARYFLKGYEADVGPIDESKEFKSPRDSHGHGTHTSSTAAGSTVKGATFLGYATGVARGMAPMARIAIYKACWLAGYCVSSDIIAAFDKAIEDNVNVLSVSLGLGELDYYKDGIAIGALAATARGIFVSASAGNYGPEDSSLLNVAPWLTTVGAGTVDRNFPAMIILGNGKTFVGFSSLFKQKRGLPKKQIPLVYSQLGGNFTGKLVVVDIGYGKTDNKEAVRFRGALGIIFADTAFDRRELLCHYSVLPSVTVGKKPGDEIREYTKETNPTAKITFEGTVLNVKPSPVVAGFSSRGPNSITPGLLKPDLIAPGVNILAAWTGARKAEFDYRRIDFTIDSGTSMSCPHVTGLAALLKAAHPGWSPAAIRSALMTTASRTSNDGKPILDSVTGKPSTPFAHGAGHVSPVSAFNPGFIYNLTTEDYLAFLCASNYTLAQIKTVARRDFSCDPNKKYKIADLNYPSFAVRINQKRGGGGPYRYTRVVTNVGEAGTYTVKVSSDITAVNISVDPAVLELKEINERKSYTVTFTVNPLMPAGTNSFGSIEWSDGRHVVKSPVALSWT